MFKGEGINFRLHHPLIFKKDWNHCWKWRPKWLTSRETLWHLEKLICPKGIAISKSLNYSNNLQNIKRYAAKISDSLDIYWRSIENSCAWTFFYSYRRLSTSLNYSFVSKRFSAILSLYIDSFWVWSDSKSTLKWFAWFLIFLDFRQIFHNFLSN